MPSEKPLKKNLKAGGSFQDPKTGRFVKGTHWRKPQPFREKSYLLVEYVKKDRSTGDIASEWGITDAAVLWWLRKHNIPRRTISEARKVKTWGLKGPKNGMYGRRGHLSPRWIDGSSPIRQSLYAQSFWKELAKTVYERDGYRCRRCKAKPSMQNKLHGHHVKPWAGNPGARFDLNNLITLCKNCHNWVHSKKNTKREYLSS
jgi:hypothetical protein